MKCQALSYTFKTSVITIFLASMTISVMSPLNAEDDQLLKKPSAVVPDESSDNVRTIHDHNYQPQGKTVRVNRISTPDQEFLYLDLNKDGVVSKSEAKSEYALRDTFDRFDGDNNGLLSVAEYKAYFKERYGSIAKTRPLKHLGEYNTKNEAFNAYDKNNDGMISIHEFSDTTGIGDDGIPDLNQKKPSRPAS